MVDSSFHFNSYQNTDALKNCAVQELLFSGPVYQVKVEDRALDEPVWVFLKIKEGGELEDMFCSCDAGESGCVHCALALHSIQDEEHHLLHEKFARSLWAEMGRIWLKRYPDRKKIKKTRQGIGVDGFKLVIDTPHAETVLSEWLNAPDETEENSLKLSSLSEEDLELWRAGKPKDDVRFELSFWSDLAKELFLDSAGSVEWEGDPLPLNASIKAAGFEITCKWTPEEFERLIPLLPTVHSNLNTYRSLQDLYSKIDFNAQKMVFQLHPKQKPQSFKNASRIGDWLYASKSGFYPITLEEQTIAKDQIGAFLDRHAEEINPFFDQPICYPLPQPLKVDLHFDEQWNLHLNPYLFKPGDLLAEQRSGRWHYLKGKGFYLIRRSLAKWVTEEVPRDQVADFVRRHSDWLNEYPGFAVHLGGVESSLHYSVDERGVLRFEKKSIDQDGLRSHDFGEWLYLTGEGFYGKTSTATHLQLPFGEQLRTEQVAPFIRRNRAELELIPHFFMQEPLFTEGGLSITLEKDGKIQIMPHYVVAEDFKDLKLRYYEEWVYAKGRGFYEIPSSMRVPEKWREPIYIAKDGQKEFLENEMKTISPWIQSIDPRLQQPLYMKLEITALTEGPLQSWKVDIHFRTERGVIQIKDLMKALQQRKFYLFSPSGCIALFRDRLLWLRRIPEHALQADGSLLLTTAELLRLYAFEEIEVKEPAKQLFEEITELKKVPVPDFSLLKASLRPYQEKGARFLLALYHYQLGGLLCDEMGLGKTHQSMALMASIKAQNPSARFLVVCPTSVLYHWEDKLREFLPSLKVLTFHGPFRRLDLEKPFDLLLTSYGILRNEDAWFSENHFDLVIYDEIQAAKNHRSKLYKSLAEVKGTLKVGLTGTPIENHLRELKTLFDLVLPGYMPSEIDYRKFILQPIEKDSNMEQKGLLNRMVKPFILRRLKRDVMVDLPEKTEEIAHCDLLGTQERLYREVLLMQRDELMRDLMDSSKAVPYLHVFSLLSRLKQICDHPALYHKTPEAYNELPSGKWELFKELLSEARESGQKVVVYSQYLGMLDIIELYLKEIGVGFASLRGSTRDRREQVELFANDPLCEVFVASLKAAGLGIDLTKASVVIHFDRWWNAARENQATDRVHRFGQSRGVQVFKLVTKNSFEERIDQIIERKKTLMEQMIGVDDQDLIKTFTREEIYDLLRIQP